MSMNIKEKKRKENSTKTHHNPIWVHGRKVKQPSTDKYVGKYTTCFLFI